MAVVFQDVYSDVGVFELLQDIPPEWGVVLAGEKGDPVRPGFQGGFYFEAVVAMHIKFIEALLPT